MSEGQQGWGSHNRETNFDGCRDEGEDMERVPLPKAGIGPTPKVW